MGKIMTIGGVDCYEKDGTAYLRLEQCARGLGFTQTAASGDEDVHWERVSEYLSAINVPTSGDGANPEFIPENVFYRLAMKADGEAAEAFQAKVTEEIIPAILKTRNQKAKDDEGQLQVFMSDRFGRIRGVTIDGEPWLVGKDVAVALGYSNPRDALARHVDDEDKNTVAFHDGIPGNPNVTVINESGLYSLVLTSKLPSAKAFKRWVTSEVLPTIRKTGGYGKQKTEEEDTKNAIVQMASVIGEAFTVVGEKFADLESRVSVLESKSPAKGENPFFLNRNVAESNRHKMNRKVQRVCDLYNMERKRVLRFLYQTVEDKANVSLSSYLSVYRFETGDGDACIVHVLSAHPALNETATGLLDRAIARKAMFD